MPFPGRPAVADPDAPPWKTSRETIYGLSGDRARIIEETRSWLSAEQTNLIHDAPAGVECIIVDRVDGFVSVRFTHIRKKAA